MSSYTLNYFNGRGRAEITRLVFAAAGVEFTDKRVEFEDWPALKAESPLGQMPFLEVDGVRIPQSCSIARYVAREHNLAGRNSLEMVRHY
jgi:glutathione S-transferase